MKSAILALGVHAVLGLFLYPFFHQELQLSAADTEIAVEVERVGGMVIVHAGVVSVILVAQNQGALHVQMDTSTLPVTIVLFNIVIFALFQRDARGAMHPSALKATTQM